MIKKILIILMVVLMTGCVNNKGIEEYHGEKIDEEFLSVLGRTVPQFECVDINGNSYNLKGDFVLAVVTDWCPTCKEGRDELLKLKNVNLVEFFYSGDVVKIADFFDGNIPEYTILPDDNIELKSWLKASGIENVPSFYFVRNGVVVWNVCHELTAEEFQENLTIDANTVKYNKDMSLLKYAQSLRGEYYEIPD